MDIECQTYRRDNTTARTPHPVSDIRLNMEKNVYHLAHNARWLPNDPWREIEKRYLISIQNTFHIDRDLGLNHG